jgi:ATP-dependent Clp protease protease subunit
VAENNKPLPFFLNNKDIAYWTGRWHAIRRVMLSGEMNFESLKEVTLQLMKLEADKTAPITLMIDSPGGKVVPTHQLEDTIYALNSPVDAVVIGDCASMATDLVQMCRRRLMLPSSRMLVHYIRNDQFWVCDDLDQLDKDINFFRERMREMKERRLVLYTKRTGLTSEEIAMLFRQGEVHRSYFTAKQAVDMKLADDIVTDFKLFPSKPTEEKE